MIEANLDFLMSDEEWRIRLFHICSESRITLDSINIKKYDIDFQDEELQDGSILTKLVPDYDIEFTDPKLQRLKIGFEDEIDIDMRELYYAINYFITVTDERGNCCYIPDYMVGSDVKEVLSKHIDKKVGLGFHIFMKYNTRINMICYSRKQMGEIEDSKKKRMEFENAETERFVVETAKDNSDRIDDDSGLMQLMELLGCDDSEEKRNYVEPPVFLNKGDVVVGSVSVNLRKHPEYDLGYKIYSDYKVKCDVFLSDDVENCNILEIGCDCSVHVTDMKNRYNEDGYGGSDVVYCIIICYHITISNGYVIYPYGMHNIDKDLLNTIEGKLSRAAYDSSVKIFGKDVKYYVVCRYGSRYLA